jgi:hypothetical protein
VTFVRLVVGTVDINWMAHDTILYLSLSDGLDLQNNNLSAAAYSSSINVRVPSISAKLLSRLSQVGDWSEVATMETHILVDIYSSPTGWKEAAGNQTQFLRDQDAPTGRLNALFSFNSQSSRGKLFYFWGFGHAKFTR